MNDRLDEIRHRVETSEYDEPKAYHDIVYLLGEVDKLSLYLLSRVALYEREYDDGA